MAKYTYLCFDRNKRCLAVADTLVLAQESFKLSFWGSELTFTSKEDGLQEVTLNCCTIVGYIRGTWMIVEKPEAFDGPQL